MLDNIKFFFDRVIWGAMSLLMPRKRPLEVLYGRVRYCQSMFEDEMTPENCARNWLLLFQLVDPGTLLTLTSMYGGVNTIRILSGLNTMQKVGADIYDKRNAPIDNEFNALTKTCWDKMQIEIRIFLRSEEENVTPGAIKHCESLKMRKYKYESVGLLQYPVFTL